MAKLYFYYGTMNSAKSANLLMKVYNYEKNGKCVICLKPATDTRWSIGEITSRANVSSHMCWTFNENENLYELLVTLINKTNAIFIDEAQFLSAKQVEQLVDFIDEKNIDIFCYGLKNTYRKGYLFEGSQALLYYADEVDSIDTDCKYCNNLATMNLLIRENKPVYEGNPIIIGDIESTDEHYEQVCYHHYKNPIIRGETK